MQKRKIKCFKILVNQHKQIYEKRKLSHLLGTRAADVRTKHDFVGCLSMHVLGVKFAVEHLQVATSAVNVLFMLDRELDNQGLAFIAKRLELCGQRIEPRILGCLKTCEYSGWC